jgi:hypothetical protein
MPLICQPPRNVGNLTYPMGYAILYVLKVREGLKPSLIRGLPKLNPVKEMTWVSNFMK